MKVKFRCKTCKAEAEVEVRERRPEEPLEYWMFRILGKAVRDRHLSLSLLCKERRVDLMIPIPNDADYVGQKGNSGDIPAFPTTGGSYYDI